MTSFKWLHLTDLHWKSELHRSYWGEIEHRFFNDIIRLHQDECLGGGWDVVFFTGDLVSKGKKDEYDELNERLESLRCKLEELGSTPLFLSVPGNHDLMRPKESDSSVLVLTQLWDTNKEVSSDIWNWKDESDYVKTIENSFKNYMEWQKKSSHRFSRPSKIKAGILPGDFASTIVKNNIKIGVIGLNTAFLQLKEGNFKGKLEVHADQIVKLCGIVHQNWVKNHHICFLMTHHPESWLSPKGKKELSVIAPPGRFVLRLCGHQHETNRTDFSVGGGPYYNRVMQATSIFGFEKRYERNENGHKMVGSDRRHGYCVGKIDFKKDVAEVRLWPRLGLWKASNRFGFGPDINQEIETDGGTPPFTIKIKNILQPTPPPPEPLNFDQVELKTCEEILDEKPFIIDENNLFSSSFIDRETNKQELNNILLRVKKRNGQIAFITGNAGVGKTRLWCEFQKNLIKETIPTFYVECKNYYWKKKEFLRILISQTLIAIKNNDDSKIKNILGSSWWDFEVVYQEIRDYPFMKDIPKLNHSKDPKEVNGRFHRSIGNYLKNIAVDPIVICFDDLQEADDELLELILDLYRKIGNNPIFLIGIFRNEYKKLPSYIERFKNDRINCNRFSLLSLEQLDKQQVQEMIASMLQIDNDFVDLNFINYLYDKTNGISFHIKIVMEYLFEEKRLTWKAGRWDFDKIGMLDDLIIDPKEDSKEEAAISRIYDMVNKRFDNLDRNAQIILKKASVLGNKFDFDVLYNALCNKMERMELDHYLDSLYNNKFLLKNGSDTYSFIHSLTREALYKKIGKSTRTDSHKKIADFLENSQEKNCMIEDLAYHYFKAGVTKKAADYCRKAGDIARNMYANSRAVGYYDWAVEMMKRRNDREGIIYCSLEKGDILILMGEWKKTQCQKSYELALRLMQDVDNNKRIRSLCGIAKIHRFKGEFKKSLLKYEEALSILKKDNLIEKIKILEGQCDVYFAKEKYDKARRFCTEALAICESMEKSIENDDLQSWLLAYIGDINRLLENYDESLKCCKKAVDIAKSRYIESNALRRLGHSYLWKRQFIEAKNTYQKAIKISEGIGGLMGRGVALVGISKAYEGIGEVQQPQKCLKQADSIFTMMGYDWKKHPAMKALLEFAV